LLERNDVPVRPNDDGAVPLNSQEPNVQQQRFDITDRRDVACLVNVFYDRVRDDVLLGPIFDDVAHVDWSTHLPRMYDFWESVLFGTATFKGTPLAVHRALARHAPLNAEAFDRWVALFQTTVDDLFSGTMADHAKNSAARIAATMEQQVTISDPNDSPPSEATSRLRIESSC
jgi:hemoglobin